MKRISILIIAFFNLLIFTGCSDILETESTRQNFDPEIGQKSDSLFYAYGIMEAMQQVADIYVYQGEMRGDLTATTLHTDSMLRHLSEFTDLENNKYNSAYAYYLIINNCTYFLNQRDTTLYTGARNVAVEEYAAVSAFRAWAYLQLVRNYERVPFIPLKTALTTLSQIDNSFPMMGMDEILPILIADLEQYKKMQVPMVNESSHTTKGPNWAQNQAKSFLPRLCYIPVDVILGDMYLELNDYPNAAKHFVTYLTKVSTQQPNSPYLADIVVDENSEASFDASKVAYKAGDISSWSSIFTSNATADIISYIPMAANSQVGRTTTVPLAFGADYYATPDEQTGYTRRGTVRADGRAGWGYALPLVTNVQIVPSQPLIALSDSTDFYYYPVNLGTQLGDTIMSAPIGDMRLRNVLSMLSQGDDEYQWITKYDFANIVLYRTSTVLLRLAEAFNRMGYCDIAFAILKDGISEALTRPAGQSNSPVYMTEESKAILKKGDYSLLNDSTISRFTLDKACGIHCHGTGKGASDMSNTNYFSGKSPYKYNTVLAKKLAEVERVFTVSVGTEKQDTINALEDLLCDEMALELAFEGSRWYDLMRLARHKNNAGLYSSDFGTAWLAKKMSLKDPSLQGKLSDKRNWYLPFKNN